MYQSIERARNNVMASIVMAIICICGILLIVTILLLLYIYSCKKCGRLKERGWWKAESGKWTRYWNCPKCDGYTYKL